MKRSLFWNILLSALFGLLSGWLTNALSSCITVIRSSDYIGNHMQLVVDDRFLLVNLSHRRNPVRDSSVVQLWDLHAARQLHQHAWSEDQLLASGSTLDGALLMVLRKRHDDADSRGQYRTRYDYSFMKISAGETSPKILSSWKLPTEEMSPPFHQFAFSNDGTILAHGRHENGKAWLEAVDTTSGQVLHTQPLEASWFLADLKTLPQRNGFVAITRSPGGQEKRHTSLFVLNKGLNDVELQKVFENDPWERWSFTADGEHISLVGMPSTIDLVELKTGKLISIPKELSALLKPLATDNNVHVWSQPFGVSMLLNHQQPGHGYLIDWHAGTAVRKTIFLSREHYAHPVAWLPGSSSILVARWGTQPPNQLIGWFNQLKRMLQVGIVLTHYQSLGILDAATGTTTPWASVEGDWSSPTACVTRNGNHLILLRNDFTQGMLVQLWNNPMRWWLIPRGAGTGLGVGLLCWLLLHWRARRRLAHVSSPQVPTLPPVLPGQSACSGNQTPA